MSRERSKPSRYDFTSQPTDEVQRQGREGDEAAQQETYLRVTKNATTRHVASTCLGRRARKYISTDDVLLETAAKILRIELPPGSNVRALATVVARNTAISHSRKQAPDTVDFGSLPLEQLAPAPPNQREWEQRQHVLHVAATYLPTAAAQRWFVLHVLFGIPYRDVQRAENADDAEYKRITKQIDRGLEEACAQGDWEPQT